MSSLKFARGLMRFLPLIGYHHVLMFLLLIPILFLSVLVAGCSNSTLANVYLISLSYAANITSSPLQNDHPMKLNPDMPGVFANLTTGVRNNATSFEIRTGYLGHCMKQNSGLWICARDIEPLANVIRDQKASNIDPLNLVYMSKTFKDQVIFSGLIFASIPCLFICFLLLSSFPNWHADVNSEESDVEIKPFPSRVVSRVATGFVALASLLTFVSVFWQHISSSASVTMHEELYYGVVNSSTGVVAMVFGWGGVLTSFLVVIGLILMILSISILQKLSDD
ncbi:hypothetical protein, variant [Blastomyces dermatitidis ER-3]|nr:uncharacterized protein BDCG_03806 [Blastomyces dermatitidis ER-3]XP_045280623.1 hypothetical protein, variant [Blastomyces dermatitidis ER-3]EGE77141.2 hypothetical protein BDDG_00078 [Blastomyces dermatitidis ATCC 18188]EQL38803.1 hypothetical protein BDFG_00334 [Blastomyces dermatitidis ATCC 26199]KMW66412.1 hypothetical protein, variant 1 [Blastomyces dermatitidis ATCC 18188]KMW66413.1 hypothetical protein, variant 2 [Blastomyces dermatitidis ATCC 18188]OAT00895.1 hypothetical protein 